jgi:hypothetical protein
MSLLTLIKEQLVSCRLQFLLRGVNGTVSLSEGALSSQSRSGPVPTLGEGDLVAKTCSARCRADSYP